MTHKSWYAFKDNQSNQTIRLWFENEGILGTLTWVCQPISENSERIKVSRWPGEEWVSPDYFCPRHIPGYGIGLLDIWNPALNHLSHAAVV